MLQNWKQTYYYENGQIKFEWNSENGIRIWKQIYYNEDWSIKSIKEY